MVGGSKDFHCMPSTAPCLAGYSLGSNALIKYKVCPVTHYQQNCSIVWCEDTLEAAVVDPGGECKYLVEVIRDLGVTPSKILLTHGHMDHVGAAAELAKELAIDIEGPHRADEFWLDNLAAQAQMMGFPVQEVFKPKRWLQEGDTITVGRLELEVLHCPGHTPGHLVFYHRSSEFAWVGDVLFAGSIGRTDFPQGNLETLLSSIRQKLFPLGDGVRFLPGHGPMSTFGEEKRSNPFVSGDYG